VSDLFILDSYTNDFSNTWRIVWRCMPPNVSFIRYHAGCRRWQHVTFTSFLLNYSNKFNHCCCCCCYIFSSPWTNVHHKNLATLRATLFCVCSLCKIWETLSK